MKKILKRKNLFIAVMLLCLGLFTSCTLDFATVESIGFVKAPAATYELDEPVLLKDFSVEIIFTDSKKPHQTLNCDSKLLTITGDIDGDKLDTKTIGLKKVTIKYENVSIMVTYEVVDKACTVSTQDELNTALKDKEGLIKVNALTASSYSSIVIDYPVHLIGVGTTKPVFQHIEIDTKTPQGVYQIENLDMTYTFNNESVEKELIEIKDYNPFAKVIIKNCDFNIKKSYSEEIYIRNEVDKPILTKTDFDNINSDGYNFISINEDSRKKDGNIPATQNYFNVEVLSNIFNTDKTSKTAVYSAINLPADGNKEYSRLFFYNNKVEIASRYVIANASLTNLEIIENDIKVAPSQQREGDDLRSLGVEKIVDGTKYDKENELHKKNQSKFVPCHKVKDSVPSALQFTIFANSLCNIKNNNFTMNGIALSITFNGNSANAIQKFIANLPTNNLSNEKNLISRINILSWVHNFKTLDFGKQNLTESQFSISKEGKEIVPINEGYNSSREYFKKENGKYVKVEVSESTFEDLVREEKITHLRKNTNISWNIRFIDTNGNEQFIDPFPGDEDIYIAKPTE